MLKDEGEKRLLKSLFNDVYEMYPDPKDANLIIAGVILTSRLFFKNCDVLVKAKMLSEEDSAEATAENMKIMHAFMIGSKAMFETFASGTLEDLLEQIMDEMTEGNEDNA